MKNLRLVMAAMLMVFGTATLMAQKSDSTRSHRHGHHGDRMASMHGIPNLTDDQKKKIKELRVPLSKEVLPLTNQLAEKKAHLKTLQTAEKADLSAINSTIDDIGQLQSQIMKKHAAHTQAVRKLLTDEQRIAFDMHKNSGHDHSKQHSRYRKYHGTGG